MEPASTQLSVVLITLLKGILYRADNDRWQALLTLQPRVREHARVLGLDLIVDEAEGFAYLRTHEPEDGEAELPRLIARRQLSFPVSLLLVLLRKRLAEQDASGGEIRLILTREQIGEQVRVFLPQATNEAKMLDEIDTWLGRIVELGFVRRLKSEGQMYEVHRVLKSFVDAQWLADFEQRLAEYRLHLEGKIEALTDVTRGGA